MEPDLLEVARRLLDAATPAAVARLGAALAELPPPELAAFDEAVRAPGGLPAPDIRRLRWPTGRGGRLELWSVLGLASSDASERERAARGGALTPVTVRLLALRSTDPDGRVQAAALRCLAAAPASLLLEALGPAEHLGPGRLDALLSARLEPGDLEAAARAGDAATRAAAARRLTR